MKNIDMRDFLCFSESVIPLRYRPISPSSNVVDRDFCCSLKQTVNGKCSPRDRRYSSNIEAFFAKESTQYTTPSTLLMSFVSLLFLSSFCS